MAVVTAERAHRRNSQQGARALDPDVAAAVDDHLVDRRVAEPSLETSERRAFGDDVDHAALRNEMSNDFGSRAIKRPASTAAGNGRVEANLRDHRHTERVLDIGRRQCPARLVDQHDSGWTDIEVLSPTYGDEARTGDQQRVLRRRRAAVAAEIRCRRR